MLKICSSHSSNGTNSIRSVKFQIDSNESKEYFKAIETYGSDKNRFHCRTKSFNKTTLCQWSTFYKFHTPIEWCVIKTHLKVVEYSLHRSMIEFIQQTQCPIQLFKKFRCAQAKKFVAFNASVLDKRCVWLCLCVPFLSRSFFKSCRLNSYCAEIQTENLCIYCWANGRNWKKKTNCHCIERNEV